MVATGDEDVRQPRLLQMWLVDDAVLRHASNGAIGRNGRPAAAPDYDFDDAAILMFSLQPDSMPGQWWVRPSTPSMMRVRFRQMSER